VDRNAYVFCVLELFHTGLRHRDIFAAASDRWSDPRARLLTGARWAEAKDAALGALQLPDDPEELLAGHAADLDGAWRAVGGGMQLGRALYLRPGPDQLNHQLAHLGRVEPVDELVAGGRDRDPGGVSARGFLHPRGGRGDVGQLVDRQAQVQPLGALPAGAGPPVRRHPGRSELLRAIWVTQTDAGAGGNTADVRVLSPLPPG
jgi:hypothetical protein